MLVFSLFSSSQQLTNHVTDKYRNFIYHCSNFSSYRILDWMGRTYWFLHRGLLKHSKPCYSLLLCRPRATEKFPMWPFIKFELETS